MMTVQNLDDFLVIDRAIVDGENEVFHADNYRMSGNGLLSICIFSLFMRASGEKIMWLELKERRYAK